MAELHVVFGTGPLGRYTAESLLTLGKSVRMVNRSGKMANALAGVEIIASDAYDVARNLEITRGATAVYQCAQPHYYEWQEKFPPLQRAILQAVSQNGAKLVVGDNLYMYGKFSGTLREDSPVNPHTKKGKVRAAMAQEIVDAHTAGNVRAALGRASNFFGPYDFLGLFKKEIAESVEMMYEWTAPFVVDTSKAQKAFGLKPTPLDLAIRETLAWCKQQN